MDEENVNVVLYRLYTLRVPKIIIIYRCWETKERKWEREWASRLGYGHSQICGLWVCGILHRKEQYQNYINERMSACIQNIHQN